MPQLGELHPGSGDKVIVLPTMTCTCESYNIQAVVAGPIVPVSKNPRITLVAEYGVEIFTFIVNLVRVVIDAPAPV